MAISNAALITRGMWFGEGSLSTNWDNYLLTDGLWPFGTDDFEGPPIVSGAYDFVDGRDRHPFPRGRIQFENSPIRGLC